MLIYIKCDYVIYKRTSNKTTKPMIHMDLLQDNSCDVSKLATYIHLACTYINVCETCEYFPNKSTNQLRYT